MNRNDYYASPFGAVYSTYMERPRLSRLISRVIWGGDSGRYYESMGAVAEVPPGGTVVDCPCGAGPAMRAVPADGSVRYVGADLSPAMLRRARGRVQTRGLTNVEIVEAKATEIPLPPGTADLFLSYWGLHCFADPAAALVEAARVLEPGGRLVGSTFVRGQDSLRQRLLVHPHRGDFGPIGTQEEVESWLAEAGFEQASTKRSGPMLFFEAHKRS